MKTTTVVNSKEIPSFRASVHKPCAYFLEWSAFSSTWSRLLQRWHTRAEQRRPATMGTHRQTEIPAPGCATVAATFAGLDTGLAGLLACGKSRRAPRPLVWNLCLPLTQPWRGLPRVLGHCTEECRGLSSAELMHRRDHHSHLQENLPK